MALRRAKTDIFDIIDSEVEIYSDINFDAERAAQNFYARNANDELSTRLNDMALLKGAIESKLKQEVRKNYGIFLNANEEIQKVSKDMADLKVLISSTQALLEDVSSSRLAESEALQAAVRNDQDSNLPSMLERYKEKEQYITLGKPSSSGMRGSKIAPWVLSAHHDITVMVIEKNYTQAVLSVLKVRAYVDGVKSVFDTSVGSELHSILQRVEERGKVVARALRRSLSHVPSSNLWGTEEQIARLRLLVMLGEHEAAARAFTANQMDVAKRVTQCVENVTGNALLYVASLSRAFAHLAGEICKVFIELFNSTSATAIAATNTSVKRIATDDPRVSAHIVQWLHGQMKSFLSTVLSRQLKVAAKEASAVVLSKIRICCAPNNNSGNNNSNTSGTSNVTPFFSVPRPLSPAMLSMNFNNNNNHGLIHSGGSSNGSPVNPFASSSSTALTSALLDDILDDDFLNKLPPPPPPPIPSAGNHREMDQHSQQSAEDISDKQSDSTERINRNTLHIDTEPLETLPHADVAVASGVLAFASQAMHAMFNDVRRLDELGLQGVPALCYLFTPDLVQMVSGYTDEVVKEVTQQVRQESWFGAHPSSVVVQSVASSQGISGPDDPESPDPDDPAKSGLGSSYQFVVSFLSHYFDDLSILLNIQPLLDTVVSYARSDVVEAESAVVTGIVLVLVRYVMELEAVDRETMSRRQSKCFFATAKAAMVYLIPSVQELLVEFQMVDHMLSHSPHSPQQIFEILSSRLREIVAQE